MNARALGFVFGLGIALSAPVAVWAQPDPAKKPDLDLTTDAVKAEAQEKVREKMATVPATPVPATAATAAAPEHLDNESMGYALVKLVIVLGLVLSLAYLVLNFGLRKLMGVRHASGGRLGLVKIVERVPVEPRVSLYVVNAAGEYLLLGKTEQGLSLLSKLGSEEVERIQKESQQPSVFTPFLQKLLARRGGPPPTA